MFKTQKEIDDFNKELAIDLAISSIRPPSAIKIIDKVSSFLHSVRAADKEEIVAIANHLEVDKPQIESDEKIYAIKKMWLEETKSVLLTQLDKWEV